MTIDDSNFKLRHIWMNWLWITWRLRYCRVPQFHAPINKIKRDHRLYDRGRRQQTTTAFFRLLDLQHPIWCYAPKVYRKRTPTLPTFDAHHPLTVKRGLIKYLPVRARKLCSSEEAKRGNTTILQASSVHQTRTTLYSKFHPLNHSRTVGSTVGHSD